MICICKHSIHYNNIWVKQLQKILCPLKQNHKGDENIILLLYYKNCKWTLSMHLFSLVLHIFGMDNIFDHLFQ